MEKQPGQDHGFEVAPNHVLSFSWAPEAGAKEQMPAGGVTAASARLARWH